MLACTKRNVLLWTVTFTAFLASFVCFGVLGAESTPKYTTYAPEKNDNNVKIYFYFDGHKSMRLQRVKSYVRAIEALRKILADRNNVLDAKFKELGYSATIKDEAFVFTPDIIEPFNLSTTKNLDNLVKEYKGPDFSAEDFYKKIVKKVPSQNAIVIIITNNTLFTEKQGIRYRDIDQKVTFFVLNAGPKSVNKDSFLGLSPYWDTEDWEKFLTKSMGPTMNDIANVIVEDYYALSKTEETEFRKIIAKPDKHSIILKDLLRIPNKEMWKREILFNKRVVSTNENDVALIPEGKQNVLSVSLLSPVGYRYMIEWTGDDFLYDVLTEKEQKLVEDASKCVMEQPLRYAAADTNNINSSKNYIARPIKKDQKAGLLKSAQQITKTAETYADFSQKIQKLETEIGSAGNPTYFVNALQEIESNFKKMTESQFKELNDKLAKFEQEWIRDKEKREREAAAAAEQARQKAAAAEQERQKAAAAEQERQKAAEAEQERQKAAAAEQARQKAAAAEQERQKAAEAEKERQKAAEAEQKRQKEAAEKELLQRREAVSNMLKKQQENYKDVKDISNYAELETLIRKAKTADKDGIEKISWTPMYSTDNLNYEIQEKLEEQEKSPDYKKIKKSSIDGLLAIQNQVKEYTGNNADDIQSLREMFEGWSPEFEDFPEETAIDLVNKCRKWIESYPDSEFDSEEECNDLLEIIDGINDCIKTSNVSRFNELQAAANAILNNSEEPEQKGGTSGLFILFILALLGLGGWGGYKLMNRKVATAAYTPENGEGKMEALAMKQEFDLEKLGCMYEVRVMCVEEDGKKIFRMSSPNKVLWYKKMNADYPKKPFGETPVTVDPGQYLLFDDERSTTSFSTLELNLNS